KRLARGSSVAQGMFRQSERQRLAVYGKNPHHGCHLETARPEYRGVCRGGDSSSSDQSTCPFSLTRGHLTWRGGLNDYKIIWTPIVIRVIAGMTWRRLA